MDVEALNTDINFMAYVIKYLMYRWVDLLRNYRSSRCKNNSADRIIYCTFKLSIDLHLLPHLAASSGKLSVFLPQFSWLQSCTYQVKKGKIT